MTGRRMIHAHKLVQEYAACAVPTKMFAARSDGLGREHFDLPMMPNPNLMKMVLDYPVYYWSQEALVKGSSWTVGTEKSVISRRMNKAALKKGAIHFFDTIQYVDNSEVGVVPCVGIIRYSTDMFAMLYVHDNFNWDNLSHGIRTFNVYFVNGSKFSEFYKTWLLMLEAYAETPIECDTVKMELTPKRTKGIDLKTRKKYRQNPVRVVTLRKLVRKTNEERDTMEGLLTKAGAGNTIGVQFDVRGHTREQWYPSEGKHRTIWVESYTKGKGKPQKERTTINKVVDRPISPPGSGIEGLLKDVEARG